MLQVPTGKLPKFKSWFKKSQEIFALQRQLHGKTKAVQARHVWEYKLYEKMFEKQQKLAADLIVYAQRATPPSVKILKKARKYIHNFLFEQDHGPFEVQSATWKNFAVAWLTPPGALKKKMLVSAASPYFDKFHVLLTLKLLLIIVKYGHVALTNFIKDEASKNDPQWTYIVGLEKKVRGILDLMEKTSTASRKRSRTE